VIGMPEHTVDGLDGTVDIRRDEWGIPHVRAGSAHDAFFAQGFVQAQDRLGQLEYDRRRAYGRWSEVAGRSGLGFDVFVRRCGLAQASRREYDALPIDARAVLDAFAAGVNSLVALRAPLPPDLDAMGVTPEPWRPWDCCAVFLARHVVFANWQKKLWRSRLVDVIGDAAAARLEDTEFLDVPLIVDNAGSNAWAIAGSRTASGLPLVAGDPHRLVEVPGVYTQCHLACDEFDVAGVSFVGVPGFPHFGQNDRVAWGVTNANGDYQDLYRERFAPGDASRYEANGTWLDVTMRVDTIAVRDSDEVTIECRETRHGPIVFGDPATGEAIALRTTALVAPSEGLSVLAPMLRATDVDELDDVMRAWVDPVNNFVSADADGNISYWTVGQIPMRSAANALGPVPGWTDEHEWRGVVPYEELPRLRNPADGMIITANQRIVGGDYPHYLGREYARPDRALRLHARLGGVGGARAADMPAVHRDRRSLAADPWVDRLTRLDGGDEWERAAIDALRSWDRVMAADSNAAAVYVAVRDAASRIVAHDPRIADLREPVMGEPRATFAPLELRLWPLVTGLLVHDDRTLLRDEETWDGVLARALADGVAVLRTACGDDVASWRWGALHLCAPVHPLSALHPEWNGRLDPPPVGVGGEWDTVFCTAHAVGAGFRVTTASVARYVWDVADRTQSGWIVPLGVSGDATSPHFADQQRAWSDGEVVPVCADWDALASGESTRLTPAPR
jgi:penicillin amidase